ncbi:uncharacterized protein LOC129585866 [Paramacrobiotus metropolitanus]|uniref:uncharacterized protein LOC129585866 n=1 Tax=Paramacrobiotus metropolitanus TaxID=2943436 RepID=UPI002446064D|nr:uncharacterized protein LOC129585866 [Paramacrobiotus metropolitanus]
MGKPKGRKVARHGGNPNAWREPKASSPSLSSVTTAEGLLEKLQSYMESCEFVVAEKFANRALERFPANSRVLEAAAECFTETGNITKARTCYLKAISVSPLKGWRKYLGLAQLLEGQNAVLQYTRGIEVMERELAEVAGPAQVETPNVPSASSSTEKDTAEIPTARDISNAYLSISELYTTDLCDDDNAEEMCKYALDKAMMADPKNPEAFQQMANFFLIKGDKEAAAQYVKGGLTLWYTDHLPPEQRISPENQQKVGVDYEEGSGMPGLALQIDTAKALIECAEYDLANRLFTEFITHSPTDPELWYLNGFSYFLHGNDYYPQARSALTKAKKFATTPHGICYDIIAQCDEHLESIAKVLPPTEDSDNEEEVVQTEDSVNRPEQSNCEDSDWETDEEGCEDVEM